MVSNDIFESLNIVLSKVDLDDVSNEEQGGYSDLPDGYYLSEVETAEIKETKESKLPMISFRFKIIQNGLDAILNDNNTVDLVELKGTTNRKVFINWVLKDDVSVKRFVSDMLKFEGENPGEPILEKEYFTTAETLEDALNILVGMRIYVKVSTTEGKDGVSRTWNNLITWKRADSLGLPL